MIRVCTCGYWRALRKLFQGRGIFNARFIFTRRILSGPRDNVCFCKKIAFFARGSPI